jgi:hypothetical protein
MLSRTAFLLVLTSLVVTVPLGTTAKKNAALISQDRPLALLTTRSKRSDGKTELKLTGRYNRADKVVELRSLTMKGARRKIVSRQKPRQSSPKQQSSISSSAVTRFAPVTENTLPDMIWKFAKRLDRLRICSRTSQNSRCLQICNAAAAAALVVM